MTPTVRQVQVAECPASALSQTHHRLRRVGGLQVIELKRLYGQLKLALILHCILQVPPDEPVV